MEKPRTKYGYRKKKKLSPPGDPNAYMQLDRCEREIEKICKTHVMYKNKKWGGAL